MDWELKTDQLAFSFIEGRHTGKNMSTILIDSVDRYNIRGKVSHNFNCLPELRRFSRLDGLLVMVLLSMAQLSVSLKNSLMKETMAGQRRNMTYCMSLVHDMTILIKLIFLRCMEHSLLKDGLGARMRVFCNKHAPLFFASWGEKGWHFWTRWTRIFPSLTPQHRTRHILRNPLTL